MLSSLPTVVEAFWAVRNNEGGFFKCIEFSFRFSYKNNGGIKPCATVN